MNDIQRSVDSVPCHGRIESFKLGYAQDTDKKQSQLFPVVIKLMMAYLRQISVKNLAVNSMNKIGLSSCTRTVILIVFKRLMK